MVSVCIATYNGDKYIKKQIQSIIDQLDSDDEVIVSDDGSSDDTIKIIHEFNDNRIKIIQHDQRKALLRKKNARSFFLASDNFEYALTKARGDIVFLSDQDDIWEPNKKNEMIHFFDNYDCVLCDNSIIDDNDMSINGLPHKKMFRKSVIRNLLDTPFLGCCMAVNRKGLSYVLPFPKSCIGHDLWIGCLCAYLNRMYYVDKKLHRYRIHSANVSPTVFCESKNTLLFKLVYRIIFLYSFFVRIAKVRMKKLV